MKEEKGIVRGYKGFKLTKDEMEALLSTLVNFDQLKEKELELTLVIDRKGVCMLNH